MYEGLGTPPLGHGFFKAEAHLLRESFYLGGGIFFAACYFLDFHWFYNLPFQIVRMGFRQQCCISKFSNWNIQSNLPR